MAKEKPDVESGSPPKQEREATKKIIRVLTVLAYLSSVSTAAIMLSLYYIFLWNPMPTHAAQTMTSVDIPLIQVIGPHIQPESGQIESATTEGFNLSTKNEIKVQADSDEYVSSSENRKITSDLRFKRSAGKAFKLHQLVLGL